MARPKPKVRPDLHKIAIVGFTQHKALAPYADPDWAIWGLNDLYLDIPETVLPERLEWFQVHGWEEIARYKSVGVLDHPLHFGGGPPHPRDANHVAWMVNAAKIMPLWLMEPRPEIPEAKVYPKEDVFRYFGSQYFTNSISWMLGLAIMRLCPGGPGTPPVDGAEIGVWGVDMMMAGGEGSEYGYQRPSCEWLLGWARAAGIKVHIPGESDLLKTAFPYGDPRGAEFRNKLMAHVKELHQRRSQVQQQAAQMNNGVIELSGAINIGEWLLKSWMPGDGAMEHLNATAPMPDAHKK